MSACRKATSGDCTECITHLHLRPLFSVMKLFCQLPEGQDRGKSPDARSDSRQAEGERSGTPPPAPPFGRCLGMGPDSMFPAGVKPIAAYRVEGVADGDRKYPREEDNAGPRRHEQDRPPRGGATRSARGRRHRHLGRRTMSGVLYAATLATALGCGLNAGVFFAFSTFVMPALKRLPAAHGIAAMQSINKLAVTPAFMTALFGTAVACLRLVAWAVISSGERSAALVIAGGALYLVGTIGVTIACNVPLNDGLATVHPQGAGAAGRWEEYATTWTAWNHVRTVAALAAAAVLTTALSI